MIQIIYITSSDLATFDTKLGKVWDGLSKVPPGSQELDIWFTIELIKDNTKEGTKETTKNIKTYETDEERQRNDREATDTIKNMLHILSSWSERLEVIFDPITLNVHMELPPDVLDDAAKYMRRRSYSYVQVLDIGNMPSVPAIRHFKSNLDGERFENNIPGGNYCRQLAPWSMLELATKKFPNLEGYHLTHYEPFIFGDFRRMMREHTNEALSKFSPHVPQPGRHLTLDFIPPHYVYRERLPIITESLSPCSAAHKFIDQCGPKVLNYRGELEPSFFWPYAHRPTHNTKGPERFWQSIRVIRIDLEMTSPQGQWYFKTAKDEEFKEKQKNGQSEAKYIIPKLPPGYGSNNDTANAIECQEKMIELHQSAEEIFKETISCPKEIDPHDHDTGFIHYMVDEEAMTPLLEAMTDAMSQMPSLQTLQVSVDLRRRGGCLPWHINYRAARLTDSGEVEEPAEFLFPQEWALPSEKVLDLFRGVGSKLNGEESPAAIKCRPPASTDWPPHECIHGEHPSMWSDRAT